MSSSQTITKALKWAENQYDGEMEESTLKHEVMYKFRGIDDGAASAVARSVVRDFHDYPYTNDPYGFGNSWE